MRNKRPVSAVSFSMGLKVKASAESGDEVVDQARSPRLGREGEEGTGLGALYWEKRLGIDRFKELELYARAISEHCLALVQ